MNPAYSRKLTINAAQCTGHLTYFPAPVKVTLGANRILNASGYDIAFYSDAAMTTMVPWEIQSVNTTTGAVVAWIRAAATDHDASHDYWMAYGDTAQTTALNTGDYAPSHVYDNGGTSNYKGVWHLGETLTGAGQTVSDSTGNANGTSVGTWLSGQQTAGKISGSLNFNGTDNRISCGDTPMDISTSAMTLSIWMYDDASEGVNGSIMGKVVSSWAYALSIDSAGQFIIGIVTTDVKSNQISRPGGVGGLNGMHNSWNLIHFVYDGTQLLIYTNGSQTGSAEAATGAIVPNNDVFAIGDRGNALNSPWTGKLCEARVLQAALTSDWIATEYASQNAPDTFVTFGTEASVAPATNLMVIEIGPF